MAKQTYSELSKQEFEEGKKNIFLFAIAIIALNSTSVTLIFSNIKNFGGSIPDVLFWFIASLFLASILRAYPIAARIFKIVEIKFNIRDHIEYEVGALEPDYAKWDRDQRAEAGDHGALMEQELEYLGNEGAANQKYLLKISLLFSLLTLSFLIFLYGVWNAANIASKNYNEKKSDVKIEATFQVNPFGSEHYLIKSNNEAK